MRFFRLFIAALCLAVLGLCTTPAHALGTLTFSPPQWTNRAADRLINVLNRQDCQQDATATFSYAVKGASGGTFEVWSGAACDVAANRSATAVTKSCVKVTTGSVVETSIQVRFQDMIKPYSTTSTEPAGVEACDTVNGAGLQARNLFFVVYNPQDQASLVTSAPASWAFKYDITAPPPPSAVTAGAGDLTLVTSFTPPAGETNLLHYHMYCSLVGPAPTTNTGGTTGTGATAGTAGTDPGGTAGADTDGTAGAADTGGTAGTGTGGTGATAVTIDPNCTSSILVPNQPVPTSKEVIDCGELAAQAVEGGETKAVLENDNQYAVAISTEDDVNNIGVLSGLACGTPKDVTGFYEAYTKAGGAAGGGYCTFAPAHHDAVAIGLGLMLAACAFWRRRK